MRRRRDLLVLIVLLFVAVGCRSSEASTDPLPSWNDGPAKRAIIAFVREATTFGGANFLAPENRFATFDNDGTLWVEQPMYAQVAFAIDRVRTMAPQHPEWKGQQPLQAIVSRDSAAMEGMSIQDFEKVIAATHVGMTTDDFLNLAKEWLATATHPRFRKHYTELVYQPMLELMTYLRVNGFKTYIVTGGGQEFVRAFSAGVYGVPVEQVIGSASKVRYDHGPDGRSVLLKLRDVLLVDDGPGKPEGINLVMGRSPSAAFGNSTGDQQMLEYAQSNEGARLELLVHHDDAAREYAYGQESKIGTFSDDLMNEAKARSWIVVSMKNDWRRLFP